MCKNKKEEEEENTANCRIQKPSYHYTQTKTPLLTPIKRMEGEMRSDASTSRTLDRVIEDPIVLPYFVEFPALNPSDLVKNFIEKEGLIRHGTGPYFKETDRSPFQVKISGTNTTGSGSNGAAVADRDAFSLITVLYTPDAPVGSFLKLKHSSIHIVQKGKGKVVLVYPDGHVTSFKVGLDYKNGESSQWVVPGGVFKACFTVPNEEFDNSLLISEVVVPGFDIQDCVTMSGKKELVTLVGEEKAETLKYLM